MTGASSRFALRWAVDILSWQPDTDEWHFLLSLLPEEDVQSVGRFKFRDDQKRALISRLLQRHSIATTLGVPFGEIVIKRTKGRKPYFCGTHQYADAPNFNFNIAHEGRYVVLASEPVCICGIDVAAPQSARRPKTEPQESLFATFERQFTASEWASIRGAGPSDDSREAAFRQHWGLKEAFVKARGDGIAFDMRRAEFHIEAEAPSSGGTVAKVWLDGVEQQRWRFSLHELGEGHWVSVARGPPEAVIDAWGEFERTLRRPLLSDAELQEHLEAPSPTFTLLSPCDLVPTSLQHEYAAAGGDCM